MLREGFGCGPHMPLDEQLAVLAELFFDYKEEE